ncbi:MAG: CRISPR-associated helicase Cas3' [Synergistaceae bacterium]|jgi:CRISPR-associated helicase Cas3/CRISPR-associated endonuclease Cas3-HD|nr:CRISPR-associated helicase Cas3' [Synergistaceae bacterium]
MKYYAHSKGDNKADWELLIVHLRNVAATCRNFAEKFDAGGLGELAGLLHDIGKYVKDFILRLEGKPIKLDHSTAGVQEARKRLSHASGIARIVEYVVAGHHSGLPDYGAINDSGSLKNRIFKTIGDYSAYREEIDIPETTPKLPPLIEEAITSGKASAPYSLFFLIKMLFSCLVDADFLETERFMNPDMSLYRRSYPSLGELEGSLNERLAIMKADAEATPLNLNRNAILAACIDKATHEPGLFSLTVPTGGGKTLSSLAFAMRHAVTHGMDRIIYVIPYTSIIEQTAKIFKGIFGEENVLEHHSNFEFLDFRNDFRNDFDYENNPGNDAEKTAYAIKLASENWDVPIIVTTNVQFFESVYANKTARSRKLHNIANSVLIFDEAQLLPVNFLLPSLECLCELCENYHSSAVLCTATQPSLREYLREGVPLIEIVDPATFSEDDFRRVKYENLGTVDKEHLVRALSAHSQAMCVVNNRDLVKSIFMNLPQESRYHLSGNMCAEHRSQMLKEIKKKLVAGEPVLLVTTQLIEAGVDIDFPFVYREVAGIDSIIQAGGRCNREGKHATGHVFVFKIEGEIRRGYLDRTAGLGDETIRKFDEIDSEGAVASYFQELYRRESLDKYEVLPECMNREMQYPYKEIANLFKLIKNDAVSVIIPYDDKAKGLIGKLEYGGNKIARKLQRYTVNVYGSAEGNGFPSKRNSFPATGNFRRLLDSGGIRVINEIYYVLNIETVGESIDEASLYSTDVGLRIEGNEFIW